jgi:hypothetical protein
MLQSEAGYIDARPQSHQIDETLLQRTAGARCGRTGMSAFTSSGSDPNCETDAMGHERT